MDWYVAMTVTRGEGKAIKEMAAEGIESFLPIMRIACFDRRKNRRVTREFPLFNKYVFVGDPDFGRLHKCRSVVSLLGVNGTPQTVSQAEVERVRHAVSAGIFDRLPVDKRGLKPGMTVRIGVGPFTGFHGQVQSFEGKKLVRVLAEILGGMVPVSVPLDYLEKVA